MNERHHGRGGGRPDTGAARSEAQLRALLQQLDGAPFPKYKQLTGRYTVGEFTVNVDRVPPDPFAGPARVRLIAARGVAGLDAELVGTREGRIAVEDWLARRAAKTLTQLSGSGEAVRPGAPPLRLQEIGAAVLERSACRITPQAIELRLMIDLPAAGRRIRGRQAEDLFLSELPRLATASLLFSQRASAQARRAVEVAADHRAMQDELRRRGLVAFVAEGSLLARASGAGGDEDAPRRDGQQVAFEVPDSLAVTLTLPHGGPVRGLGIPAGVTLIVGGAFHGKSTLLDAVARAVYPHPEGDGRERVASLPEAVTVRAEDGRSVRDVDISAFLGDLPSAAVARRFTTEKASGSTSQAAAIVEAIEAGAKVLLLDEDRCATNFMIRDGRMQRLVPRPDEPITPFLDRVRELYDRFGVSTILVTGGSGDYLEAAHTVIRMKDYRALEATAEARGVVEATISMRIEEPRESMTLPEPRTPCFDLIQSSGRPTRFGLRGPRGVRAGDETLEIGVLQQIVETGQTRALAQAMRHLARSEAASLPLRDLIDSQDVWLDDGGLDRLEPPAAYDLSRPRRFELAAVLNRWRALPWRAGKE